MSNEILSKKEIRRIVVSFYTKQFLGDIPSVLQILTFTSVFSAFFPSAPYASGALTLIVLMAYYHSNNDKRLKELVTNIGEVYKDRSDAKFSPEVTAEIVLRTQLCITNTISFIFGVLSMLISYRISLIIQF